VKPSQARVGVAPSPATAAAPHPSARFRLLPGGVLRGISVVAAGGGVLCWSRDGSGYGWPFWLWVSGVVAYVVSFALALRRFPPPAARVRVTAFAIMAAAAALRLPSLDTVPPHISIDEVLPGYESFKIAQGAAPNVFSSIGWYSMPNLSFAPGAVVMRLSGAAPFRALRLASALTGLAGLACVFLLGRRLLGERAALIAIFLMAVSFWHIHNSRTGFPFAQPSLLTALVVYLLIRARQDGSAAVLALAGVTAGLALQCYFPVRILVLICPLVLIGEWRAERAGPRRVAAEALTFAGGTLLALAPLLACVPLHELAAHSRGVLLTEPGAIAHWEQVYGVQGVWAVLLKNMVEATRMFTQWADVAVLNRSPAGLVDQLTLMAMLLGVCFAILDGRRAAVGLALWMAVTLLCGVVLGNAPRASYRLSPAMPALFLLAGYGGARLLDSAAPAQRRYTASARVALIVAVAAWIAAVNYERFFDRYPKQDGKQTSASLMMRLMAAQCDGRAFYLIFDATPSGRELEVFCPHYRSVSPDELVPQADLARPATFLVAPWQTTWLDRLRRCWPAARVTPHTDARGQLLLTAVDVSVEELRGAVGRCVTPSPP
jgi:4-amino-4-deoxy-L-arabinose transferase-like glycosyltransferase